MKEKKVFKKSLIVVFLILIILLALAVVYFIANNNKNIILKQGNYTVNEIKLDGAGVTNEDCGIKLKENNEFEIYVGYGCWYSGKYEIKDNKLICNSNLYECESGYYFTESADVIHTFEIVDDNNLKLLNIEINDSNTNELSFEHGFSIGMTYSIK